MASASLFETPGTCFATKEKSKWASMKNKHFIICAICLSLHAPEFTTDTTASLSQQQQTVQSLQCELQIPAANIMGSNSFITVELRPNLCGTCRCQDTWNHAAPHTAPHPQDPDASECSCTFRQVREGFLSTEMPFHFARNVCHHSMSALLDSFNRA